MNVRTALTHKGALALIVVLSGCVVEVGNPVLTGSSKSGGGSSTAGGSKMMVQLKDQPSTSDKHLFLNATSVTFVGQNGTPDVTTPVAATKGGSELSENAVTLIETQLPAGGSYKAIRILLDANAPAHIHANGSDVAVKVRGGGLWWESAYPVTVPAADLQGAAAKDLSLTMQFASSRTVSADASAAGGYTLDPRFYTVSTDSTAQLTGTTSGKSPGVVCAYLADPTSPIPTGTVLSTPSPDWMSPTTAWATAMQPVIGKSSGTSAVTNSNPSGIMQCGDQKLSAADFKQLQTDHPSSAAACTAVAASLANSTGLGLLDSSAAVSIAPPPVQHGTVQALDQSAACSQAFAMAAVNNGQFTMPVVAGTYRFRVFYADGSVADGAQPLDVKGTDPVSVNLP